MESDPEYAAAREKLEPLVARIHEVGLSMRRLDLPESRQLVLLADLDEGVDLRNGVGLAYSLLDHAVINAGYDWRRCVELGDYRVMEPDVLQELFLTCAEKFRAEQLEGFTVALLAYTRAAIDNFLMEYRSVRDDAVALGIWRQSLDGMLRRYDLP